MAASSCVALLANVDIDAALERLPDSREVGVRAANLLTYPAGDLLDRQPAPVPQTQQIPLPSGQPLQATLERFMPGLELKGVLGVTVGNLFDDGGFEHLLGPMGLP